jgi:hypothetical protein
VRAVTEAHHAAPRADVRPGAALVDGAAPTSPYLTTDEATAYLRFGSPSGLWNLARRVGVRPVRRGRKALWTIPMLDAMVLREGTDGEDEVPGRVWRLPSGGYHVRTSAIDPRSGKLLTRKRNLAKTATHSSRDSDARKVVGMPRREFAARTTTAPSAIRNPLPSAPGCGHPAYDRLLSTGAADAVPGGSVAPYASPAASRSAAIQSSRSAP